MKLNALQKIALAFFVCTLVPAFFVANWRFDVNDTVLSEKIEREEELLQSAQKLLSNCQQNESKSNDHYDANHQVCSNGEQARDRATAKINTLSQDKEQLHSRWWSNFMWTVLCLNVAGILAYKSRQLLQDKTSV